MSIDQKVRGNLQVFNLSEIWMRVHIESITEEIIDATGPELTGWQANIVDDEQLYLITGASTTLVRRI